jgi:hypothetical protein
MDDPIWVGPSARSLRPDKSTLVILNKLGDQVLFIRLLNKRAVEVHIVSYTRQGARISVGPDGIHFPVNNHIARYCFEGGGFGGGTGIAIVGPGY